jgi:NhaP-type Na+/H+ or K+/H+ antiporter
MEVSFQLTLQIIIVVLSGITAQVLAEFLKVPSIVFLLSLGILLGPDGFAILHPQQFGIGLEVIVALSVAIILFDGGFNLTFRDLGLVSGSLRNLITVGMLVTLIGGGIAAHWLAEFPLSISFLYSSLIVVTGPTVVSPLLKQVKVDHSVATLLEGEGVLIDSFGAILGIVVLNGILNSQASPLKILTELVLRLGIGAIVGGAGGYLLIIILRKTPFISEELKNLVVLAGVWGLFGLAQSLQSESGLMAVVLAGIILRASAIPEERLLIRFKGQLTVLCISVVFILLAADLSIASVFALGWGSVWTVLSLMFLVRPLNIWLCTMESGLNWRQKFFLAWVAPRGIVSASVASLFAIVLTRNGINGGDSIKALVFLTILMTVFVQGLTAKWIAKILQITSEQASGAVIIGCNPLGILLGSLYRSEGENVILIDTNPEDCRKAELQELNVVRSSGLDPTILFNAGINSVGTFIALTTNGEVNLVLAQKALEEFSIPTIYAVFPSQEKTNSDNFNPKINSAFIDQSLIKIWNQYIENGQVKLTKTKFETNTQDSALGEVQINALIRAGELLPLLLRRNNSLQIFTSMEKLLDGDELVYLLHDPRSNLLKRLSDGKSDPLTTLKSWPKIEEISLT